MAEKTGEFAELPPDVPRKFEPKEQDIYFAEDLIAIYTVFRDQVYDPQSVLYPCCGFDASPAKVFKKVTFVDLENGSQGCVRKLQEAGFRALKQDIRTYTPTELHDLLILLNPAIPTEWASKHLQSGGYVIANDYHKNAAEMHYLRDQFTLIGVINIVDRTKERQKAEVSRDITDLFVPVQDEEELKRHRPDTHDFISKTYPHILRSMRIEPAQKFEDMYAQFQRLMHEPEHLPAKRVADRYIFVKK